MGKITTGGLGARCFGGQVLISTSWVDPAYGLGRALPSSATASLRASSARSPAISCRSTFITDAFLSSFITAVFTIRLHFAAYLKRAPGGGGGASPLEQGGAGGGLATEGAVLLVASVRCQIEVSGFSSTPPPG